MNNQSRKISANYLAGNEDARPERDILRCLQPVKNSKTGNWETMTDEEIEDSILVGEGEIKRLQNQIQREGYVRIEEI